MRGFEEQYGFTEGEWNACLKVLAHLKDNPLANPDNQRFSGLVGKLVKQAKKAQRKVDYKRQKQADLEVLKGSTIADNALRGVTVFSSGMPADEISLTPIQLPRNCYCCHESYDKVHGFYGRLCPACAAVNYRNRFQSIDLTGRNVIVTGGRVKIGYATALKFLRANAKVTVTTRFPATALQLFEDEEDYGVWKDRLVVYGLDLRSLPQVQEFVDYYRSENHSLEVLVNNAAQTIKYDADYYRPLIGQEQKLLGINGDKANLIASSVEVGDRLALASPTPSDELSVAAWEVNRFGQPVDGRSKTSWNSTLGEIDLVELLEVNLINQISPYVLIQELTPLLKASTFEKKFIINVTSAEGQFSYTNKSIFHPHTNMTKASLNMLTRTSAHEYVDFGVYMNAVDVGWVSTGATEELRKRQFAEGYIPPLDPVDGASRIMMPIIDELVSSVGTVGKLFKNYLVQDW